jgi:ribonuclease E
MTKRMLIDALHPDETRVVVLDNDRIQDFDFTTISKRQIKSNIYLAKVTRVEPSLQAAFVEYGGGKQGFLPFAEIHPDYYQIPVSDRQRLLEEVMREQSDDYEDDGESHGDDGWHSNFTDSFAAAAEGDAAANGQYDDAPRTAPQDVVPFASLIRVLRSAPLAESVSTGEEPAVKENATGQAFDFNAVMQSPILPLQQAAAEPEAATALGTTLFTAPAAEGDITQLQAEVVTPAEGEVVSTAALPAVVEDVASEDAEDVVETLGDDEDAGHNRRKNSISRRYRIQEVIKRGQIMLVQVIKEERGNKGVSLTSYISLPGRYCVLMPNSTKGGGISRKIAGSEHRKRLRELVSELSEPQGMSVIIRTAGMDRSTADIRRDYDYLVRLWNQIRETTLTSSAPALIYEEGDLIKRSIRDMYTSDINDVLVSGEAAYNHARDFMEMLMPHHVGRVLRYEDPTPLFYYYGVENKLANMYEPTARLRSGGYLVINSTEALISIDVNSGRSTGERNIEETAKKTNLEAAEEVARQLRLRDLAGLIVIDFIDMNESRNRRAVERALKDALKADRAKIQIGRISPFGLLEMSRQRLRPSISEAAMVTCSHCNGRGHVRADNTVAIQITRAIQHELALGACDELRVQTSNNVALYLLNHYRKVLTELEAKYGVAIRVLVSDKVAVDSFQIDRIGGAAIRDEQRRGAGVGRNNGRNTRRERERERVRDDEKESADSVPEQNAGEGEEGDGTRRRRRSRGGRRRRGERGGENGADAVANDGQDVADAASAEDAGADDGAPTAEGEEGAPRRRSRGGRRRGGRNRRGRGENGEDMAADEAALAEGRPALDAVEGEAVAADVSPASSRAGGGRGRGGRGRGPRINQGEGEQQAASKPVAETVPVISPVSTTQSFAPSNFGNSAAAVATAVPAASADESDKPKRFGWWRK